MFLARLRKVEYSDREEPPAGCAKSDRLEQPKNKVSSKGEKGVPSMEGPDQSPT